uniref:hypothetical protein n=1 Tax=Ezakiella massiliensis TaxID=1852374 RepID=UPI00094E14F9|nr:hypothetical protein [Ezakiella massiliensis]
MKKVLLIALAFLIFISLFYGCVDKNVQVEKKEVENAQNEDEIEKQAAIESLKKQIEIQQMEVDELKKEIEHQKEIERKIIEDYEKSLYGIYKANKLIYHNDDYGFSIEIPEEKYNIKFYNVIQDKIEENIEILNFEFFTEDENNIEVSESLFQIIVCKNNATYPGAKFLSKLGDIAFYFRDSSYDTESSAIKALIEELKPMLEEIKASFRFDE